MFLLRAIDQWRSLGLPRCAAYFYEDDGFCHRLIWPWQDYEGPVDLVHATCKRREQEAAERYEREHPFL